MLGLIGGSVPVRPTPGPSQSQQAPLPSSARFLLPVGQCEYSLTGILEGLQRDPWAVGSDKRAQRCTGVALGVATGLLESSFSGTGARIMLFAGGPATQGPGMVTSTELREPIRSHHDIDRDHVKYYKKALKVSFRNDHVTGASPNAPQYSSTKQWPNELPTMDTPSTFLLAVWIRSACSK